MQPLTEDQKARFQADGFLIVEQIIDHSLVEKLRARFERLFHGEFETGVAPDEVNWLYGRDAPDLTRQICNGWKADPAVAGVVLDPAIGRALAELAGWPGARVVQDNVIWKPPGARSLGYHRDNAYLGWLAPREMLSCWIALDDTTVSGGTMEVVRGSHLWPEDEAPEGAFHAPEDYRAPLAAAARSLSQEPEIVAVEVPAGGGLFHHGWTWHGSGPNRGAAERRALVIHGGSSRARFDRRRLHEGNAPIYGRYRRLSDDAMDENHFPVTWARDGHRTPGIG